MSRRKPPVRAPRKYSRRRPLIWLLVTTTIAMISIAVFVGILSLVSGDVQQRFTSFVISQVEGAPSNDPTPVIFTVHRGESASEIADRLERERLISSAFLFRALLRTRSDEVVIAAGEHVVRRNMTMTQLLAALRGGSTSNRLTILEGWRAAQIGDELEYRGIVRKSVFNSIIRNRDLLPKALDFLPADANFEGYLFPDTYAIADNTEGAELVKRMLDNFVQEVMPVYEDRAYESQLKLSEVVTLASIIEREARLPEERPIMASVYLNRLREGMLLQADPTVQYAIAPGQEAPVAGYWKQELSLEDLASNSPYNTYQSKGLPPGPICSPGLASIKAVLNPARTDYFYFVAKGDGSHAFSRTLEEHNKNVRTYQ